MFKGTFRSLSIYNYRMWASGAIVSNIGTWMQRTAQDWLVLTHLTNNNATALGIVMALQFGPQFFLLPVNGFAADYFDRRKLLIATQASMGLLALGLGLLVLFDAAKLWHVYVFALLFGCVTAFDTPARQTFVSELVSEKDISNAVALNSTSFNTARMIGPAVSGVLIGTIGTGWVFMINAVSFGAVLLSLMMIKKGQLHLRDKVKFSRSGLADGFRYIAGRPDLKTILLMFFLIGTFGLNFPIFISTMAVSVFHADAHEYGILTSIMAVGSVTGALLSAGRDVPRTGFLFLGTFVFGAGFILAAFMPHYLLFGLALAIIGISAQTFTTTALSAVQLLTEANMRGRVLAILFAISWGGTVIGAPIVGRVADIFGARWSLSVGAASGLLAAAAGLYYIIRYKNFKIS
ncbi:MFS transporter [Seleniivibrio woodruffii]|uniref:MFS transporter n=1 Tax=Seleniivibrio woodruffii TaxID=1078050 RepID=UPI0039E4464C